MSEAIPVPAIAAPRGRGVRGRLFRKYVGLFVAVVCVALFANGLFEIWFSYQEHKTALIRIQREQAEAAAAKIGQFVKEIEGQLGWTVQLPWSASTLEQRRFDALRLLRQVPAITELSQLDSTGKEQLRVSRLAMDVVGSGLDLSKDPKFAETVAKKVYYGPVYFRRESEPYMTLAVAGTRRDAGVSVAEVNLKLIWDVISQIKVGQRGHAYVVGSQGRLIAHPDISLVLRNTDLSGLPQVQAAQQRRRRRRAAGGARHARPQGAHRPRPRRAAALARLRRAAGRGGLCAALRIDQALRRPALRGAVPRGARRHVPRATDGGADPGAARGRRAHRPRRAQPAHPGQDRRRDRGARRPVQRHGRQARGVLRRARAEGRSAHAGADRIPDRSRPRPRTCSRSSAVPRSTCSRCWTRWSNRRRVCAQAETAFIFLRDGAVYRLAANHGFSREFEDFVRAHPISPGRGTLAGRVAVEAAIVHIPDVLEDPEYTWQEAQERGGMRTMLGVPLLRQGTPIGVLQAHAPVPSSRSPTSRSSSSPPSPTRR